MNATFYRRFADKTYHKWREQAPDGFRNVLKTPRLITHRYQLKNVTELITDFSRSCHLLGKLGANYCNPDSPDHQLTGFLTGKYVYLRFHGSRQWYADKYNLKELLSIAETARQLQDQGAKEVFIFFNNDFEGYAPANAADLLQLL